MCRVHPATAAGLSAWVRLCPTVARAGTSHTQASRCAGRRADSDA